MTTNTAPLSPPARQDPRQVLNTLEKLVNYNDVGISAGVKFANSLPAGAHIIDVQVQIHEAFNGGTNNLFVGTNASSFNNIVNGTADVNATIAQNNVVTRGWGKSLTTTVVAHALVGNEATPTVMYTQTGAAATQGLATIVITFTGGANPLTSAGLS